IESAELPRLVIFTLLAALLATMSAARRRAEDALTHARAQLEARVLERTAELERSNERLQGAAAEAVTAQHRFRDLVNSVDGIVSTRTIASRWCGSVKNHPRSGDTTSSTA